MIAQTVGTIGMHVLFYFLMNQLSYTNIKFLVFKISLSFVSVHFSAKNSNSRFPEDLDTSQFTCSTVTNISNRTRCSEKLQSNEKTFTGITTKTTGSLSDRSTQIQRFRVKRISNFPSKIRENDYEWSQSRRTRTSPPTARPRTKETISSDCPNIARRA